MRALRSAASAAVAILAALAALAMHPRRETVDLLVVNARVLTVGPADAVIDPGGIAVRDGSIVALGPSALMDERFAGRARIDARGKILMPGLVNTHTHAAMTLLRGLADDLPLDRWLSEHIFPAEAKNVSAGFVYDGTLLAALEMIEGGTTTFADMYYFEADAARAVERAGLRAVLGETFLDFPVPDHSDLAATLAAMRELVRRWKGNPRILPAVAPHSIYTCSKETLLAARDFAREERLPILIHLAETRKELEDARSKWGKSPVAYLASIGFFDRGEPSARVPIVAAHAVWVDAQDREILRRTGVAVSHNPESNMKLGSGVAPIAEMAREGIAWSLGTDGPAGSNNDLSLFEAMDFAGKLAKSATSDPTALPARDLVRAATLGGAQALGLGDRIGSIEVGKRADFILVDSRTPHAVPWRDVYSALVYSIKASDVTDVWVDGRRLLAQRRPQTLDSRAILRAAAQRRRRVEETLGAPSSTR